MADYAMGVAIVDPTTHAVSWVAHADTVAVSGIDGMYLVGRTLYAIQNGTQPERVTRFDLDPSLDRVLDWSVIERATPGLGGSDPRCGGRRRLLFPGQQRVGTRSPTMVGSRRLEAQPGSFAWRWCTWIVDKRPLAGHNVSTSVISLITGCGLFPDGNTVSAPLMLCVLAHLADGGR